MKGYKAFNKDMTCRGFQYEIGKEFEHKGAIGLCESGFHYCKRIIDVQNFYNLKSEDTRLCEIEAIGQVIEGDDKCVTDKIKITREISKEEMYILANEGNDNVGIGNTGDWNTGDWNTGNRNTGNRNTGDYNTGNRNTGDYNTGNRNTGNCNTGHRNTGNRNTGNCNTGHRNTGNCNTGHRNTGDCNTGNWNTGSWNTGGYNTGDWNKTNRSAGIFCNEEPKLIMFNKETNMTWNEWRNSKTYYILAKNNKSQWVLYDDMTNEEKEKYSNAKTCNGYLKEIERSENSKEWWKELTLFEKAEIIQLPNFDLDIFNDIMELKISKKEYEEICKWIQLNKETY